MATKENTEYTSISVGDNIDYLSLKEKNSVIIGENTGINILQNAVVNTEYNVFIGNNAGQYSKEIENSIFIGANAGKNLEKGSQNIIIGEDKNNILDNIDNIISIGYNNIFNNSIYNNILGNSNILNNNITNSCNNIIGINNNINNLNNSILLGNYNNIVNNTDLSSNLIYIGNNLENTNNYSINLGNTIIKDNTSNIFIGIENNINTCIGFNNINTINNIIRDETSNIYYNVNEILNVVDFTKNIFENELLFEETCNIHNKYYQLYDNTDVKFDIIKVNSNIIDDKIFSYSYITDINNLYYDNKNTLIQKIEENTIINHIEHSLYVNNGIHTDHLSIINNSSNKVSLYSPDNLLSNISYILPKNIDNIDLKKKYILSLSNINELFWILNTDLDDIDTNTRFETLSLDNISNGVYNKYITSNIYDDDLSINGNLNVRSLNIISGGIVSKIATTQDLDNIQGPMGPRGLKGDPGQQGLQGIQGIKGDNGLGIKDINYTDGIITIIRDDDTSYMTNNIIGEKGDGFTNVYYTKNTGKLTFVSDNTELNYETPSIKGDKGDKGDNCGQIRYFDNKGNFLAEFGDSTISTFDIYIPEGQQGIKGSRGDTGPRGDTGLQGDTGPKGDTGSEGPRGPRGFQGVASVIDANYAGENINIIYDSALSIYKIHGGYTAGANVSITNGVISSTDTNTQYSAGNNISINGNVISCTDTHIDTSNYIENVYSNILETSNYINNINDKIIDIDKIDNYTSKFNSNLIVQGTLKASNLEIIGESTIITTNTYQTENIIITNTQGDGVSIKIDQNNNTYNIFEASNFDKFFIIDKNGYVGINKEPVSSLDINGDINFITNINNITSNELNYLKNVNYPINTNFIDTSNYIDNVYSNILETSNYIYNVNTIINTNVNTNFIDTSNYIDNVYSNILETSNYIYNVNTIINTNINTNFINTSNYIDNVNSNIIDTSNYIDNVYYKIIDTSNYIDNVNSNIIDTSNYIDNVYYKIIDTSNYIENVNSNININISDTSNYIENVNSNININILDTSNYIDNVNSNINLNISDTSNYIDNVNNNVNNSVSNTLNYIDAVNTNIHMELNNKASLSHNHDNIYISTSGGDINGNLNIISGNIGIGTIIPTEKLTINKDLNINPILGLRNGADKLIFNNASQIAFGWNGFNEFQHFINTRHNNVNSNNAIDFYTCDGTKNNTVTYGSIHTMSIDSGKVGISTSSPSHKLTVYGEGDNISNNNSIAIISNTNPQVMLLGNQNTSKPSINLLYDYANFDINNILTYKGNQIQTDGEYLRIISFNGIANDRLCINSTNGNIGIGVTTPGYKLEVSGDINIPDGSDFKINGLAIATTDTLYTDSDVINLLNNGITGGLKVTSGNVGIGTQNPDIKLEIYDTSDVKSRLYSYTGDSEFQIVTGAGGDIARLSLFETSKSGIIGTLGFTLDYNGFTNIFSINRYNGSSNPEEVLTIKRNSGALQIKGDDLTISCPNYTTIDNGLYVNQGTSTLSITSTYLAYLTKNDIQTNSYWTGSKQAIYANGNIMTSSWFLSTSDERIKEEIEDVDDGEALEILRKIRPVKYHYKDISRKGQYKTIGFIAQQIKEVLPNAVKITNNKDTYIPNIQEKATYLNNIITLQDDSSFIPIVDSDLQLIGKNEIYKNVIITEVIDDKNFKIQSNKEIDLLDNDEIVLYGEKVNDLHTLAKDCINAVMLSAVQELDKKIESQQEEINMLKQHLGL